MQKVLFTIGLLFLTGVCHSQKSLDIVSVSGRYGIPSRYADGAGGRATERGVLVNLKLPVVLPKANIWFTDVTYTWSGVDFSTVLPVTEADPVDLHAFVVQTGWVKYFDNKSALQLLFVPRFMTDLVNPRRDAWQFGGVGLFERQFSPALTMKFGALYNAEIAGPMVVPLVGVDWQISTKWFLAGLFPIYGKLGYRVSQNFTTGLSHFGLFTSYRLSGGVYAGDFMERRSIDLTLFAERRLFGNLFMEARFGYALDRGYEQYHAGSKVDFRLSIIKFGDHRGEPVNQEFGDGFIANLRAVYRIPTPP